MKVKKGLSDRTVESNKRLNRIKRKHLNTFCCIILLIDMKTLEKVGLAFILLIIIVAILLALLYFFDEPTFCSIFSSVMNPNISSKICGSQIYNNNSIIMKAQHNFTTTEINAIENSHLPITINPANTLVFGSFKNTSQRICGQQQAYFVDNLSKYEIEYNGFYFPVSITIGDLQNSATETNLIGQKVYLSFITNNNKNISALYIINKIYTKGNMFYWILGQDTGISNNSAILDNTSYSIAEISASELNGAIFLNETPLISPMNPDINFTATNC